ncbi:sigma-70 family RNA polymerase sigma factor [Streptomyces pseudovenezuelae]|uniref:RNA polymerase sigma factor n=1 Tax=Streptomyces pseudovenezuelae TaxID=67350 RepID=UPI002E381178|nr:sigma-70 family RNA polymerase sigma factor [Streptomyces pseudovenezuelae]
MAIEEGCTVGRRREPSGDDFDSFFRKEYRKLVGFLRWIGASQEEAEDSAQTAMLKALVKWTEIEHPRAWVRTAAERHFLRSAVRDLDAPTRAIRGGWGVSEELACPESPSRYEQQSVLALLGKLGYKQRQVMAYYIDGFCPTEIAAIIGDNPATVRSNLRSARINLDRILQENNAAVDGHGSKEER